MPYVLVLLYAISAGGGVTTVPGYYTKEHCEEAGKAFDHFSITRDHQCIPAPDHAGPPN